MIKYFIKFRKIRKVPKRKLDLSSLSKDEAAKGNAAWAPLKENEIVIGDTVYEIEDKEMCEIIAPYFYGNEFTKHTPIKNIKDLEKRVISYLFNDDKYTEIEIHDLVPLPFD